MSEYSIHMMYEMFGRDPEHKCKECTNLMRVVNESRFKCSVWGYSGSTASDFRKKWDACGMFNRTYAGTPTKEIAKHMPRKWKYGEN